MKQREEVLADLGHAFTVSKKFFDRFDVSVEVDDEFIYFDRWLSLRRGMAEVETIAENIRRTVWVVEEAVYYPGTYWEPPEEDVCTIGQHERLFDALMHILQRWSVNRYEGELQMVMDEHPRWDSEDYDGHVAVTKDWVSVWEESGGKIPLCVEE